MTTAVSGPWTIHVLHGAWTDDRQVPKCTKAPFREPPRSTSSVSRVLFRAQVALDAAAYHSSRATIAGRLEQPTRGLERAVLHLRFRSGVPAYVALLPMGSASPSPLPWTRWAFTPPFHPYPARAHEGTRAGRSILCCTFLGVSATGR